MDNENIDDGIASLADDGNTTELDYKPEGWQTIQIAARTAYDLGFSIVPLKRGDKHPNMFSWNALSISRELNPSQFSNKFSGKDIGLVCGFGRLFVVDIDEGADAPVFVERFLGSPIATIIGRDLPGRCKMLYKMAGNIEPPGQLIAKAKAYFEASRIRGVTAAKKAERDRIQKESGFTSALQTWIEDNKLIPNRMLKSASLGYTIEIKSFGTQAAIPPSIHPNARTGEYTWKDNEPPTRELIEQALTVSFEQMERLCKALRPDEDTQGEHVSNNNWNPAIEVVISMLEAIRQDNENQYEYRDYFGVCAALHHYGVANNQLEKCEQLCKDWAAQYEKYAEREHAAIWRGLHSDRCKNPRTISTLRRMAEARGWIDKTATTKQREENNSNKDTDNVDDNNKNAYGYIVTDKGSIIPNPFNIERKLDQLGVKRIAFNEFTGDYEITVGKGAIQRLDDHTFKALYVKIQRGENTFKPKIQDFEIQLEVKGYANKYNPVIDYFEGLKWDGVARLDNWLVDIFGADDNRVNAAIGSKTLIAAVRRVKQPGTKFDAMLTLAGKQGQGKSWAIENLCPNEEWYSDNLDLACSTKELMEQTSGKLFIECPELVGMQYNQVEKIKAKLSRRKDSARLAFGKFRTDKPRTFVLFGTTNEQDKYLKDPTGNRRYWCVNCKVQRVDIEHLLAIKDQLWAEAVVREAQGEKIYIDDAALLHEFEEMQEDHEEVDPWMRTIADWLEMYQPDAANDNKGKPGDYGQNELSAKDKEIFKNSNAIALVSIWTGALEGKKDAFNSIHQKRIANCMRKLHWMPEPSKLQPDKNKRRDGVTYWVPKVDVLERPRLVREG